MPATIRKAGGKCVGGKSSPHSISQCDKHQETQSVLKTAGKSLFVSLFFHYLCSRKQQGNRI